jgi:hypothetical protein
VADDLARFYHLLGLEPDASPEAVKVAYRDCVDAWHPDRFTHSPERQQRAQARLRQINEAYVRLRRQTPSTRQSRPAAEAQAPPSGPKPGEAPHPGAAGPHARTSRASAGREEAATQAPPPDEAPPIRRPWLELANESRFTVTTLYFSFIGIAIAAGCGLSLGGMYFGPLGAVCGVLVSPLAGLSVAVVSAALSSAISARMEGFRGIIFGSALALLLPGTVCGAVMVWCISRAILGDLLPPLADVALGGVFGAGCGMGLGAWTGKAISIAMGELESG